VDREKIVAEIMNAIVKRGICSMIASQTRHRHPALGENAKLAHPGSCDENKEIPRWRLPWNPTLAQKTRKNGAPGLSQLSPALSR
jgi:hypothetical protein